MIQSRKFRSRARSKRLRPNASYVRGSLPTVNSQPLLFFRLLCRSGFVRRFVGVLSRLFLQVGFEFLAVDFAILVGVDFVEMVGEGSALQLFASQASVGVLVEVVE